jgi:hypothetical protein
MSASAAMTSPSREARSAGPTPPFGGGRVVPHPRTSVIGGDSLPSAESVGLPARRPPLGQDHGATAGAGGTEEMHGQSAPPASSSVPYPERHGNGAQPLRGAGHHHDPHRGQANHKSTEISVTSAAPARHARGTRSTR